ncbi:MAG TPA: hypothetical protein VKX16_10060 [Chloroflexota bacterium]|nr:hypothetical protein [Chloroflexota bacterium]
MLLAFRALGRGARQLSRHAIPLLFANICALLISAPILLIVVIVPRQDVAASRLLFALLIAVLPNPAVAGVHYMLRQYLADDPYAGFGEMWAGLRRYFLPALLLWLAALPVSAIILANLLFYAHLHLAAVSFLEALWIGILVVWLGIHLYVYPLLMEQEDMRPLTVYRNATVITFARPLFTGLVLLVWLLLLALFALAVVPLTLIGLSAGAAIQESALSLLLPLFRKQPAET